MNLPAVMAASVVLVVMVILMVAMVMEVMVASFFSHYFQIFGNKIIYTVNHPPYHPHYVQYTTDYVKQRTILILDDVASL
jgi:hypothetical protein